MTNQPPSTLSDPTDYPVKFHQRMPPPIFAFGESSFPVSFSFYSSPRSAMFLGATAIQLGTYITNKNIYSGNPVVQLAEGQFPSLELLATGQEVSSAAFYLKTKNTDGSSVIAPAYSVMEMRQPSFPSDIEFLFYSSQSVTTFGPTVMGGNQYYPVATMELLAHRFLSSGRSDLPATQTSQTGSTALVLVPASSYGFVDVEIDVVLSWYEDESRTVVAHNHPTVSVPRFGLRVYSSFPGKFMEGVITSKNSCTATSLYPTTILNELGGDYAELSYWGAGADGNGLFWGEALEIQVSSNGLAIQNGVETASYLLRNDLVDYDMSSSSSSSLTSINSSSSSSSPQKTSLSSNSSASSSSSPSSMSDSSRSSGSSWSSSSSSSSSLSSQSSLSSESSSSSSALAELSSSSSVVIGASGTSSSSLMGDVMMHFGFDLAPDVFGILYDDSGKENNLSMAPVSGGIGPPKWDYGYGINGGGLLFSSDPNHTNYAQSSKMGWLSPRGSVSIWLKAGISGNKVGIPFCVSNGFAQGKTEFAISTDLMTKTVSIWLMIDGLTRWMASTSPGTLAESAWTQVVVTHDGSKPRIYVNGVGLPLEFSQSNDLTAWMSSLGLASSPATKFYVGGAPRYYSPLMAVGFSGQVDELTVWDQPLSGSTIYELFSEMDSLSSQSFSSASSGA